MKKNLFESTSTRQLEKHANQANRIASSKATVMQAGTKQKHAVGKKSKGKVKKTLTKVAGIGSPRVFLPAGYSAVQKWARLVEHPFVGDTDVKCPFNFNPAPSVMSVTVTTVNYENSLQVNNGTTRQINVWPGHAVMAQPQAVVGTTGAAYGAEMDEVAYHSASLTIPAVGEYIAGPAPSKGGNGATLSTSACMYSAATASAINGVVVSSLTGAANMVWDNPFPVTAEVAIGSHMRWKMIAMGIRIRNITPAMDRGGSIVSVQPAFQVNVSDYANQAKFSQHPSFRVWGDGSEEVEITWVPRTRDLAYWHMSPSTIATGANITINTVQGPGILIWLNAPGGNTQNYEFTQIAHWEIAGTSTQIFSSVGVSSGVTDQQAKSAIASHLTSSPTAAGFSRTLHSVVTTGESLAGQAVQGIKTAFDIGRKVVNTGAHFV